MTLTRTDIPRRLFGGAIPGGDAGAGGAGSMWGQNLSQNLGGMSSKNQGIIGNLMGGAPDLGQTVAGGGNLVNWIMGLFGGGGHHGGQATPAAPPPPKPVNINSYQADGGTVKRIAGLTNPVPDTDDQHKLVPIMGAAAGALEPPSYISAMERMHESRKRAQGLGNSLGGLVDAPGRYAGGGGLPSAHHPYGARGARPGAHLIQSSVPGRTDRIKMPARPGSYVIPAHLVSGLGQGNTQAGAKMWGDLLSKGPYGSAMPKMGGGHAMRPPAPPALPRPPAPMKLPSMHMPKLRPMADGGPVEDETTPIVTAGGEVIVDPEVVATWGEGGDIEKGKQQLDKTMMLIHKQILASQNKYPGPVT